MMTSFTLIFYLHLINTQTEKKLEQLFTRAAVLAASAAPEALAGGPWAASEAEAAHPIRVAEVATPRLRRRAAEAEAAALSREVGEGEAILGRDSSIVKTLFFN
jgi:hypothetical protein